MGMNNWHMSISITADFSGAMISPRSPSEEANPALFIQAAGKTPTSLLTPFALRSYCKLHEQS